MSQIDDFLDGKTNSLAPKQNAIDAFLDGAEHAPSSSTASDLAKSLKVGVERLPGMATGLADLPIALATGARPFTKAADALGEVTGFQPGKWADDTKFSAGYEQGKKAVDAAWESGSAGDIAKAYLQNPGYTANQVAESIPSMVAGGLAGRALMGAGRIAAPLAEAGGGPGAPGLLARAVGEKMAAPVAGGIGEGAVTAGQQMQQYQGEDQQKNAAAALAAGVGTGALGVGAGRVANKLGLETAETAIANAGRKDAVHAADEVPMSAKRRILGGMVSEAVLQELPQSAQEQMWQNYANGKPLMEGVLRQGLEGAVAGGVMGAGANVSDGGAGKRRAQADAQARQRAEGAAADAQAPAAPLQLGHTPDPLIVFPDGTTGRQSDVDAYLASLPEEQRTEARARLYGYAPQQADIGTSPGAADPNAPQPPAASAPQALDATTAPGAAQQLGNGVDFTRDVDTSGLSLQDPAEMERAHAATIDYQPGDTTPQWGTSQGAAPARQGLDMPAPEIDTGNLGLQDTRTPSQRMGIDPAAGPLSKAAATAVDSGASAAAAQPIARENTNAQAAQAPVASAAEPLSAARAAALETAGPASISTTTGVTNGPQAEQTQPRSAPPAQAGRAQAAEPATGGASTQAAAGAPAPGALSGGAPAQDNGAARAAAPAPQGQAQAAAPQVARPDGWRTNMLRARPVAKGMGIDTKGKRLAQVVAEIDAADTRAADAAVAGQSDDMPQARPSETLTPQEQAAFDERHGIEPGRRAEVAAKLEKSARQNEKTRASTQALGMRSQELAADEAANGPYPQQASVRTADGHWQPAAHQGGRAAKPIDGAPLFSTAGAAARWGQLERLKSRPGSDAQALARQQEAIAALGQAADQVPVKQPARTNAGAAVAARGASQERADQQAAHVAPQGREVSRETGKYKQGLSEFRANQVRDELARQNPGVTYTVEEDSSLKNGYAVVGRKAAAARSDGSQVRKGEDGAEVLYSQSMSEDLARELQKLRPPATKETVRAAVRQLVNGLGMLPNRLGRVVVASSDEIKRDWQPLVGDVSMEAESDAGKAQGFYDPNTKTVFLIADHINAGDELGVVAHELMHKHGQAVLGEDGWNRLHGAIEGWAKAPDGSMERRVYDEAATRVRKSRPKDAAEREYSSQELFPYAVQVALEMGVKPNMLAQPGTVARWLGQVRAALRQVWDKITRKPDAFQAQDLVNLAFGIAQRENPEHGGELDGALQGRGLEQFKALDDIYALPKSKATSIEQIARDNGEEVKVRTTDLIGEKLHTLTFDNGTEIRITERKASPYGQDQQVYGFDLVDGTAVPTQIGRPGENPEDVPPTGDVWLDVSQNTPAKYGAIAYNIAATYAHNTGRIFIGDPAGLSDQALRRRTEQMLSSALKFGTTEHLAPHPRQVAGDAKLGVPPLRWVYGDHVGNIERMIDVSLDALDNALPDEARTLSFDRATGQFRSRDGHVVQPRASTLGRSLDDYRAGVGKAQAGWRTLARAAYLRSFRGADGRAEGSGILDQSSDDVSRFRGGTAGSAFADPKSRIFYSRQVAPAADDYTPAQASAAERAFGTQKKLTPREKAQAFRANLATKLRQGLVDQFAPIKEVSEKAYILARLSKGSDGAVEAALLYGKPFLRDGVYDVDIKDGGFAKVLASLKGEDKRFLQWVAALRAERLKAEGKENLLTDADISALKSLNAGRMADGAARTLVYAKALQELNAFNESALKVAMESGLIDQAAYDLMKDQPYVPFYRLMEEEGGMRGPRFSSGLVNQQAWKKLKGGTEQLNADLLQNLLLNWSHLYAAAARNRASLETMAAADKMGIVYQVGADTKGAVKVMRDGVAEHWAVEDPYLLDAISAMSYAPGGLTKAMAPFKRLLTFGVTVNPTFKIRNLIRDSLSAMAQGDLSYNPAANVANGWKATSKESQTYASMLASGGVIKFGTQENTNALRDKIAKLGGVVLDDSGWGKLKGQMKSLWEVYEEFGDRTENVNRAALYERLIAKGHSHAEASFMARDLMDFSMSGKWEAVRFLAQTVPFLNARLQGLYKLGRAAKEDPRRFAAVAGAVSLASLGLLAAYGDDDDWKKREDWDRDAYWWFKIGDKAFRIPRPFEVGAIGTLAERTAELMFDKEMTGQRFGQRISSMVFQTFAMDPTPQVLKPFIDVYANKDSFSGRAIEGMADERLRPQDRYNERTSEIARLLGSWGLPDPVRLAKGEYAGLSPKQIDFLLRGYFGWMATVATTASDMAARPLLGRGDRPALRLRDTFLAGNFVESLPTGSSRYVTAMYEQAKDVEQAWASYQDALKSGDMEKAREIQQDEAPKLRNRFAVENAKRRIAELGQEAKRIESNRLMSADAKRARLDEIEARKHQAAQRLAAIG